MDDCLPTTTTHFIIHQLGEVCAQKDAQKKWRFVLPKGSAKSLHTVLLLSIIVFAFDFEFS